MDFKLTEEQEFFRRTIADTVDRMIMPKVEYIDELCHGVRGGMPDVYREALAGAAIKLQGLSLIHI